MIDHFDARFMRESKSEYQVNLELIDMNKYVPTWARESKHTWIYDRPRSSRIDYLGAILLGVIMASILYYTL